MQRERVVVTGVGAVTPFGLGRERLWAGLAAGENAIRAFDLSPGFPVRVAGMVPDFPPEGAFDHRTARRTGRFGLLALWAAREAVAHSGLEGQVDPRRLGVVLGTAGGMFQGGEQVQVLEDEGPGRVDPLYVSRWAPYMAAVRVGRELGAHGPVTTVNSACASGLDAIGQATLLLRAGQADVILAGGAEAIVQPLGLAVLARIGALTRNPDPQTACRPFDRRRDGFVLAEGAGVLVLEREAHARARGAPILAEVLGVGWSYDAADETAPDAQGQALAMQAALKDAQLSPQDLSWVKAHGTSTVLNDRTETQALHLALGQAATQVPVSSLKSMMGHAASASGGVEAVGAVMAMQHGLIPPTIHLEEPDPACDLDYVPKTARPARLSYVLLNAFGLGGQNSCLVLGSPA